MIYNEYSKEGPTGFEFNEKNYRMTDRSYDVIEVILLGLLLIEDVIKLAFTTRYTRKVRTKNFTQYSPPDWAYEKSLSTAL